MRCRANPDYLEQDCGSAGQVCQDDGACACDDNSCPSGQRCNGIACVCDATSCPNGCCDGSRVCRINEDTACGTAGGVCNRCEDQCVDGACTCGGGCPSCQTCNPNTGLCRPDAATDGDACGDGGRCLGGRCICDETSCPAGCCDDAGVCHVEDADACGIDGGTCTPCANSGEACEAGACCATAGRAATVDVPCCAGLNTCADGVCRANCCVVVTCTAAECHIPGVCDPLTGVCSAPTQKAPGASCDDGDACTSGSACTNGVCGVGSTICTNQGDYRTTADATCVVPAFAPTRRAAPGTPVAAWRAGAATAPGRVPAVPLSTRVEVTGIAVARAPRAAAWTATAAIAQTGAAPAAAKRSHASSRK